MAKIEHDKYYTPKGVVLKVIELVSRDIMPIEQFTRIIEPSAGAGAFMRELPNTTIGYDILPEYEGIIKGDYLEQDIEYKKNSLVIGNPPFGTGVLPIKFLKKSMEHSDFVAFILPGDNYKREKNVKGVKLFKSYMLPKLKYSGVELNCCLNIYIKTTEEKRIKKIKGVVFYENVRIKKEDKTKENDFLEKKCDYRFVNFGTIRIVDNNDKNVRVREMKILFEKKVNFKPVLENFLKNKTKVRISVTTITKQDIINLIYDTYPELRVD